MARALIEFREAEAVSEREIARRTWLSEATIRTFERGRGDLPTPTVARTFEELLGWAPGSIKTAPSETTGREASADLAMDLEQARWSGLDSGRLRSWPGEQSWLGCGQDSSLLVDQGLLHGVGFGGDLVQQCDADGVLVRRGGPLSPSVAPCSPVR
ncbi:helix-turn-helix transcriptional regulator [Streptomyces sp. Li-HN-5-11]|uniref:helix-turn-helix domain-containing protein n=1 Tax=Streptomyces sp. Li-HN-5-11 TaxID=3075432 RepID=UPI0028A6B311|nr:helix-turn-helix transcriptional regulator [Streptomyces sp. Li-HN-5-11]WNM36647.1 helix-turn-helix transcriptional regulator [Streptomyces sp. Li-HN-5-11]